MVYTFVKIGKYDYRLHLTQCNIVCNIKFVYTVLYITVSTLVIIENYDYRLSLRQCDLACYNYINFIVLVLVLYWLCNTLSPI